MELPIYKAQIDVSENSELEVNFIGLVDRPAIERNFLSFNGQQKKLQFAVNSEDRVVSGPAMIADMPIYRNDYHLGEYFVMFDKAAIKAIVEKFSAKGYLKNFNLFHDAQRQVSDVTIFNSFITNQKYGIRPPDQFSDAPDGSWFISAQINNDDVWNRVKAGEVKGFSVEGVFSYAPVKETPEQQKQLLSKLAAILNSVE